jgi:hypothetical protein
LHTIIFTFIAPVGASPCQLSALQTALEFWHSTAPPDDPAPPYFFLASSSNMLAKTLSSLLLFFSDVDVDADVTLPSVKLLPKREIVGEARPAVVKSTAAPPIQTFSPLTIIVAAFS